MNICNEISWDGFAPGERVVHKGRVATVEVVLLEFVPTDCVPIRYADTPFPYVVVPSGELVRMH